MKASSFLIYSARGSLIDEEDLVDGLQSKQIAGAGLDVFASEPANDSPLILLPNVLASPHLAGNTRETMRITGSMAVDNALAVVAGAWPDDVVVNEVYCTK